MIRIKLVNVIFESVIKLIVYWFVVWNIFVNISGGKKLFNFFMVDIILLVIFVCFEK